MQHIGAFDRGIAGSCPENEEGQTDQGTGGSPSKETGCRGIIGGSRGIGAGQASLALGHELTQTGRRFLLVDRHERDGCRGTNRGG